jgi:hypothetical protein
MTQTKSNPPLGQAPSFPWFVRQHGVSPLYGLRPTLEARSGSRRVTGTTSAFTEDGQRGYRGSISFRHTHPAVGVTGLVSDLGPDLTDRRFTPSYLAKFLANPSIKPPTNGKRIPDLGLRQKDIEPLVAFINAGREVTRR